MCYAKLEKYEKAIENYLIAYEMDRDDIFTLTELGWVNNAMEKYDDAIEFLLKAEKLGRDDEWINTEIGLNQVEVERHKKEQKDQKKSLTMVEDDDIEQKNFYKF